MLTFNLSDHLLQHFDKAAATPRNQQLYALLRKAILDRVLPAHSRLPSSRHLAGELGVSRNTVLFAYEQLLAEGFLSGRIGSGTYVTDTLPDTLLLRLDPLPPGEAPTALAASLSRRGQSLIAHAGTAPQQWGAFVPGVPDVTQFPHRIWNSLQNKTWRRPQPATLTYSHGGGHAALREAVASYLKMSRSVNCEPEQVVITSGIHQSIDLCLRLLSDPDDVAWVEDPCYWGARNLVRMSGLQIRPVKVDAEGMCPDAADMAAVPRFIFVTPSHQYPLGVVMSLARRRLLLEYARQHGSWIIEDDYDSEFRYNGRPLASLQGLDRADRVLYMGTFSKIMYPGLRLGYLVLPPGLTRPFITGMEEIHRSGQVQMQAAMAAFMEQGTFTSHIRNMRTLYASRLAALQQQIAARCDPALVKSSGSDAGLHLTLALPRHCDDVAIADAAGKAGVAVRPLSGYYHDPAQGERGLVLGYACVRNEDIAPAFAILADQVERHL